MSNQIKKMVEKGNITNFSDTFENKKIQDAISKELGVQKSIEEDIEFETRVIFLKTSLIDSGTKSLVLGVSGGVDSLTASIMCQKAISELRNETGDNEYKFIAVKLPYKTQKDAEFVEMSLDFIKPDVIEHINIAESVDAVHKDMSPVYSGLDKTESQQDFIKGNIKARMRMIAQYALANAYNGLVIGTDHAAEAVSGFFTKFGDGACDVAPLSGLVKQQVRSIAKFKGAPEVLYAKVATADLEDMAVNKPDEEALGVSYDDIDNFLLVKDVSKKTLSIIANRYMLTEHKRQLPKAPNF